jgi:predicted unusual protein kinase regulating ubiquinone biosynthesis (AarF/ABC1/UbiB family)
MFRKRYRQILFFFARITLSIIWWDIFLSQFGFRKQAQRSRAERYSRYARQFRYMAARMGGVLIKMGQFLSTRLDVLPGYITSELAGLQDEVQPESFEDIRRVVEAEFGMTLEEKYAWFDPQPMAAASIGQAHKAHLSQADSAITEVVVKVQRPHIEEIVDVDLSAVRIPIGWLNYYKPIRKRVNVFALLDEFSRSLHEEIDYLNEGKNAERFGDNFAGDETIRVPQVIWSHTTRRVLTLEDVSAIKISDYEALDAAGIDRKEVAKRLMNIYLKQLFEHSFFHADPHPGNLFILPTPTEEDPSAWVLTFIDFGMTGSVTPAMLKNLREVFISVGTRDAQRLIKAYKEMNVLLPGADTDMLVQASQAVFDRFWGRSTSEMMEIGEEEMKEFVLQFGKLLYDMPFQIPESLILLGRCVGILSGMCSGLDPEFNIWNGVVPYARKLIADDGVSGLQGVVKEVVNALGSLAGLPHRAENLMTRLEQGKLEVRTTQLENQVARLAHNLRHAAAAVVFAALLLSAVQLYLAREYLPAGILAGLALVALIAAMV